MKQFWTVSFCDCGGYAFCFACELPCEHDQICPQCRGYEWYARRVRDVVDLFIAKDIGWLYRTKRDAMVSIAEVGFAG